MTFGLGKKTRLASFLSIVTESACGTMRQFGDWSITCPEPKELRTPIEGLKRRLPGLPLSSAANHDSTSPAPSHHPPRTTPYLLRLIQSTRPAMPSADNPRRAR